MNRYNQVVVVEGKHDKQKLNSVFPELECIVTNGSCIDFETLNLIKKTSEEREVILFLDPDIQGKKITQKILDFGGNYSIAYIKKEKAISKNRRKVGIEHANRADIIESLNSYFTVYRKENIIMYKDLMKRGLVHQKNSKNRRHKLCKSLNIGILNGKSLVNTLNMLKISLERVDDILESRL